MVPPGLSKATRSIIIFGESGVGKTCFLDMLLHGQPFVNYDPVQEVPARKLMEVDGMPYILDFLDINASHYREGDPSLSNAFFESWIAEADGVVMLYDITSPLSFKLIIDEGYTNIFLNRKARRNDGMEYACQRQRFGCVLVGTKLDLTYDKGDKMNRESLVSKEAAEQWAMSQGKKAFELNTSDAQALENVMVELVRDILKMEKRDDEDIEETERIRRAETTVGTGGERKKRQSLFGNLKNKVGGMKGSSSRT